MKHIEGPSKEEFEKDRRALEAEIDDRMTNPTVDDPEQNLADAELLRNFHMKHRARLEANGIDVAAFLSQLAAETKEVEKGGLAEEYGIEGLLQAKADLAETSAEMIEAMFRVLRFYESRKEEDWAAQTKEEQEQIRYVIGELRAKMPDWLAQLPIQQRRALERGD